MPDLLLPGTIAPPGSASHNVYTTDDNCGYAYQFSPCAGKWGDCCNP
jgi:hypothetical protein